MEWVMESNELAARTWFCVGVKIEEVKKRVYRPWTLHETELGKLLELF